jgi:hypothetical protein
MESLGFSNVKRRTLWLANKENPWRRGRWGFKQGRA